MDSKSIFIIVLGSALVLSFIFRPSKDISIYEDEIGKVSGYVNTLNADGVANELANYLNRR